MKKDDFKKTKWQSADIDLANIDLPPIAEIIALIMGAGAFVGLVLLATAIKGVV